jgi:hypothetical protein
MAEIDLEQAIKNFRKNSTSPEAVTTYWKAKLPTLSIPDCDWTQDEIATPMRDINGDQVPGIMLPSGREITLSVLGEIFPKSFNREIAGEVQDTHEVDGWVRMESIRTTPNWRVPKDEIEDFAFQNGYLGGRIKSYLLALLATRDLHRYYLNEDGTWTWLLGSHREGEIMVAGFLSDNKINRMIVSSASEYDTPFQGGWRFEETRIPHKLITLASSNNGLVEHRVSPSDLTNSYL